MGNRLCSCGNREDATNKEEAEKWNGTITRIYLENMMDKQNPGWQNENC